MKTVIVLVVFALLLSSVLADSRRSACVVGGGASGSKAAVYFMDHGYENIVVLEQNDKLGGMCNTVLGPSGTWNEPGVAIWPNTTYANSLGYGPWLVDMVFWTHRFGVANPIIPQFFQGLPDFAVSFSPPLFLGEVAPPPPTEEQIEARARFANMMNTTYRCMDTLLHCPNPLFPELLVSLNEFLFVSNLTSIIEDFISPLYYAGFGDFNNLTAWDGLLQRTSTNLLYGQPNGWFSMREGCQSVYNNIAAFLGDAVKLNVDIDVIRRPGINNNDNDNAPVIISGTQNGKHFVEVCDVVVITVAETLANLEALGMDLTPEEVNLFKNVQTRTYYTGTVNVEVNTALMNASFTVAPIDLANPPLFLPIFPSTLSFYRHFGVGETVIQGFSETPLSESEMMSIMTSALEAMVESGAFLSYSGLELLYHGYNPHWPRTSQPGGGAWLGSPISPYNQALAIQGNSNTIYGGLLFNTPDTMAVYNYIEHVLGELYP
jgi:NAD(P)-binding Rossmann-like domain